tara:strand:+ start:362 stop:634 length:273 start_codon:yes stop_codon:yes gene_type:complete
MKFKLEELGTHTIIKKLSSLDFKDLDRIEEEVKYLKGRHFRVGANVSFERRKDGSRLYGVIHKVNPKSIGIDTEHEGRWKVSTSLVRLEG